MSDEIKIEGYVLGNRLRGGSFWRVWRAQHEMTNKEVAVRILHDKFNVNDRRKEKFRQEVAMLSSMEHENIVPVVHAGFIENTGTAMDGYPFIMTEYMPGGDLKNLVNSTKKFLGEDQILQIAEDTLEGLSYVHQQNALHLDIHQGNILFNGDGSARLSDFGLAKWMQESEISRHSGDTTVAGKYRTPESVKLDWQPSVVDDIYQFGATLYFAATGGIEIGFEAPGIKDINEDFNQDLEKLIHKSLARNPDDRYQTAEEMLDLVTYLREIHGIQSQYGPSHVDPFNKIMSKSDILSPKEIQKSYRLLEGAESELGDHSIVREMHQTLQQKRNSDEKRIEDYLSEFSGIQKGTSEANKARKQIEGLIQVAHAYEHHDDNCPVYQEIK